jgi:hypothetical protein
MDVKTMRIGGELLPGFPCDSIDTISFSNMMKRK